MKKLALLSLLVFLLPGCVSQETDQEDMETAEPVSEVSVWEGDGFTFEYPNEYIANELGLWTEEAYEMHINPTEECSVCNLPTIRVEVEQTDLSLEEYIMSDTGSSGLTLEEAYMEYNLDYEALALGENEFTRALIEDMYSVNKFYTMHEDMVVTFSLVSVYWDMDDTEELEEIMSTLVFE